MANRVEELCSKLESHEFLDTSEYGYAEENKAILEEDILPELSALRDIFSNNDASVVSMSSIILGDDPSQVSKEDLATIATGLMSSGTDDSISKIFKDEISNAISAISKTSIIDNNPEIFRTTIMDQVHAVVDIVKGSNVMASENEAWGKVAEKCESVLASNLEKLPDNVKEQLAEADIGIFSYGKDQDGNIDKSVLMATPDMKLKDNGSLSNQFGITFQGKLCGIVNDPKATGIVVEKLATIMNNILYA